MATFTHHAGYQKFKHWSIYSTRYNVMQLVVSLIMNEEMMVVIWLWYSVVNVYHTDSQN